MREKDIEKILVCEVKKLGGRAYKWVSPGNDGVPDRIVIFPNQRPAFVELKADGGKLSALQEIQIRRLRDLGQYAEVVRGMKGLAEFFRNSGYTKTARALEARYGLAQEEADDGV